ncbi:hypothetical protein GCM10010495_76960 [Kitasatospora herbaricolor]|nr:hypothetical protein GCM10010495_76960 [Kitasatospora herbaricolor]
MGGVASGPGAGLAVGCGAPERRPAVRVKAAVVALAILLGAGAVVQVYRIGDSGAQATWQGVTTVTTNGTGRPNG